MGHFKKSLFTFIFFAIAITLTQAQSEKISIQGTLKNANGTSVDDGSYSVTFKLYDDPTAGNVVWTEVATVEVAGGIYSHNLGSVTALSPSTFATTLYLGVKVGAYELMPRTELTYALYALSVGFAQKVVCSGAVGDVKYSILNPTQFAAQNGSCWVPMDGCALATTYKLRTITGLTVSPNAGSSMASRDRTLLWSTGETTDTILVYETGRYDLNVTVAAGCSKETLINVVISDCAVPPSITLGQIVQPTCTSPLLGRQALGTLPDGLWTLFQTGHETRCTEGTGADYEVPGLDTDGDKPGIYRFRVADPYACCSAWTNPFGVVMVRW